MTAKSLLEECFPDTLKKHAPDTPKKAAATAAVTTITTTTPNHEKDEASTDDEWLSSTDESAAIDQYLKVRMLLLCSKVLEYSICGCG